MTYYRLGLLGYPTDHSLSPRLHQAALAALNIAGRYDLFSIPPTPEGSTEICILLERMRRGKLHGLNVTIPHKMIVINYLDELSPTASAIGAVNAILVRGTRLVGENFDCPAFMADVSICLNRAGKEAEFRQPGQNALVLGAGGAARAVAYGLLQAGWQVKVAARRYVQALDLAHAFCNFPSMSICELDDLSNQNLENVVLIVNATPLGMHPNLSNCAWPERLTFPPRALVYDLVYNPDETALLASARKSGLPVANGLGMLVRQAALSLEAWTGQTPDYQQMYRSATSGSLFRMTHSIVPDKTERKP